MACNKHGVTGHMLTRDRGKERYRCRACNTDRVNKHRRDKKLWCVKYLGGKCQSCGYDRFVGALEFHHRDPNEKEFEFARYQKCAYDKLKKELDKCDLLCSVCHKEAHGVLDGTFIK